jgi:hypothetical protein
MLLPCSFFGAPGSNVIEVVVAVIFIVDSFVVHEDTTTGGLTYGVPNVSTIETGSGPVGKTEILPEISVPATLCPPFTVGGGSDGHNLFTSVLMICRNAVLVIAAMSFASV